MAEAQELLASAGACLSALLSGTVIPPFDLAFVPPLWKSSVAIHGSALGAVAVGSIAR